MNPYASPYHRAVISAHLRRTDGPERNPALAARIACRHWRVLSYAAVMWADGHPALWSQWRRKLTGNPWQVVDSSCSMVRVKRHGISETEAHSLAMFLDYFEPLP